MMDGKFSWFWCKILFIDGLLIFMLDRSMYWLLIVYEIIYVISGIKYWLKYIVLKFRELKIIYN